MSETKNPNCGWVSGVAVAIAFGRDASAPWYANECVAYEPGTLVFANHQDAEAWVASHPDWITHNDPCDECEYTSSASDSHFEVRYPE